MLGIAVLLCEKRNSEYDPKIFAQRFPYKGPLLHKRLHLSLRKFRGPGNSRNKTS